jgi:hypothetical protein
MFAVSSNVTRRCVGRVHATSTGAFAVSSNVTRRCIDRVSTCVGTDSGTLFSIASRTRNKAVRTMGGSGQQPGGC